MVNPNETTLPNLLKQRGYKSALFGKFHLGIQSNDPYGYGDGSRALGFDYFDGWLDATGDPSSIDQTAGGVSPAGTWSCGFVRDAAHGGADSGACYAGDGTCTVISEIRSRGAGPCLPWTRGGIFDPDQACADPVPGYINFATLSGTLRVAAGDQQRGWIGRAGAADRYSRTDLSRHGGGRRRDQLDQPAARESAMDGDACPSRRCIPRSCNHRVIAARRGTRQQQSRLFEHRRSKSSDQPDGRGVRHGNRAAFGGHRTCHPRTGMAASLSSEANQYGYRHGHRQRQPGQRGEVALRSLRARNPRSIKPAYGVPGSSRARR